MPSPSLARVINLTVGMLCVGWIEGPCELGPGPPSQPEQQVSVTHSRPGQTRGTPTMTDRGNARLHRRITTDTALRLSRFFGTSDRFWLNLQARYDLEVHSEAIEETLAEITPLATE